MGSGHPQDPAIRPFWNTSRNETKGDDSVELSRFFIFGEVRKAGGENEKTNADFNYFGT